jgi:hypothetical protein
VPLPTGVDLCAYRILQEALTNVRRHAPGAASRWSSSTSRMRSAFECEITARSRTEDADGHGLLGMRERAIMVGGTLSAGRRKAAGSPSMRAPDRRRRRMTIKVAVVDDQEIVRAGFAALLGTQEDFASSAPAADGEEAVELCRTKRPHVVLMDVRMPVMDGIEATRRVTSDGKRPAARDRPDHVRPRRVRLRRARRRGERLPAQGRDRRHALRCRACGRGGRRAPRTDP